MTSSEFHDWCSLNLGVGRLNVSVLSAKAVSVFEAERARAMTFIRSAQNAVPRLPVVYLDFIDDKSINAVAFRSNASYGIGINAGVLVRFYVLFHRALADAAILPWIGNSAIERTDLPPISNLLADDIGLFGVDGRTAVAKDPLRRRYALHLAQTAFDFLVSHELTHIANGHVDFLNPGGVSVSLVEVSSVMCTDTEKLLTRQTMEMDADACAASHAIGTLLIKLAEPDLIAAPWKDFYASGADALFTRLFSIYSLFRLFGDTRFTGVDLASSSYPPLPLRGFMALATIATFLEAKQHSLLKVFRQDQTPNAISQSEEMFARLTGARPTVRGLQAALGVDAEAHMERLRRHWEDKLRPRLVPLAFAKLPA